ACVCVLYGVFCDYVRHCGRKWYYSAAPRINPAISLVDAIESSTACFRGWVCELIFHCSCWRRTILVLKKGDFACSKLMHSITQMDDGRYYKMCILRFLHPRLLD